MKCHDWATCHEIDCNKCQDLVDCGIICACDECDMPGHTDAAGCWTQLEDGRVLCLNCLELEKYETYR